MGMNQSDLQAINMQQMEQQQGQSQTQDPFQGQAMTGGHPDAQLQDQVQLDPMEVLSEVILQYMDFAQEVRHDQQLDIPVKSKIMLEQSQAINYLITHITAQQQNNPQQQMLDMQMKVQQHQQDLQMKHEAHVSQLQQAQEKHALEVQKMQHDLEMQKQKAALDLINNQQKHEQQIVHQEQQNKSKLQQQKVQKQAAQSNHSNKQPNGNNSPKK